MATVVIDLTGDDEPPTSTAVIDLTGDDDTPQPTPYSLCQTQVQNPNPRPKPASTAPAPAPVATSAPVSDPKKKIDLRVLHKFVVERGQRLGLAMGGAANFSVRPSSYVNIGSSGPHQVALFKMATLKAWGHRVEERDETNGNIITVNIDSDSSVNRLLVFLA